MRATRGRPYLAALLAACLVLAVASTAQGRTVVLKGTVTGMAINALGKVMPGTRVVAYAPKTTGLPPNTDWTETASATTGKTGTYKLSLPPGTYRIWFVPADTRAWCMEAYPDAVTPYHGGDVVVRAGRTTSRISVTLDGGPSSIAGRVYDAATGEPLPGVSVALCVQGYAIINAMARTRTDAGGDYFLGGLKSFDWGVGANVLPEGADPAYGGEFAGLYDWSIGDPGPGATAEVLDIPLQPRGFVNVAGRLVDELTGEPLAGYRVTLWADDGEGGWWTAMEATSGGDGRFSFADVPMRTLPADTAVLLRADGDGAAPYGSEWYSDGFGDDPWGAPQVGVARGVLTDLGDWGLRPAE